MSRRHARFTLIELLVCVGVIALLIAIVMPVFSKVREKSRQSACKNNLHGLGISFRMYLNDYKDIMPIAAKMPSLNLNTLPRIADVLAPQLSTPKLLRCPSDRVKPYYETEGSSYEYNDSLNGQKVSQSFLAKHFGESKVFIMYDYEPFHGKAATPGAANYLFVDGHVGDLE